MSNRKYAAAVLEGGPASADDRMKSIARILSDRMNAAAEEILNNVVQNNIPVPTLKAIIEVAEEDFKDLAPDLEEDYKLLVTTVQEWENPGAPHKIVITYHKKLKEWEDWWGGNIHSATIGNIDASRITANVLDATRIQAGSITADRIQPIRVVERYGMGVINTASIARAQVAESGFIGGTDQVRLDGTVRFVDTTSALGVNPILFQQNELFDLTIGNTTYHDMEITGMVEDV